MARTAHNKISEEKIIQICEDRNLQFVKTYYDKEKETTYVEFICNVHQKYGIQKKRLQDIICQKNACSYCGHNKLKDTFEEEIGELHPDILLLSKYTKWDNHIKCRCKIDGFEWDALPSSLFQENYMCKECRKRVGNARRKTLEQFKTEMAVVNPNIEIIDDKYLGTHKPIKCKCKVDGKIWESYPCNLLNKSAGCPQCFSRKTQERCCLSQEEFENKIPKEYNIEILSTYTNVHTLVKCKCLTHDYIYMAKPMSLLYKGGNCCPLCNQTLGEQRMNYILNKYGIYPDIQHKFGDCVYRSALRFDAYDEETRTAFEYQGEQHFYPVDFSGKDVYTAQRDFESGQIRDNIKRKYCKKNNIILIEIPYWEYDNMESFLLPIIKTIQLKIA